ncbi:ABC transporter [Jannaschia sp. EhC01]|nr:ABC transporter [Jannaschia sp. EhC01]
MSGLLALLDDVAAIAKVAAASVDDVIGQAAKAGAKAAGAVIDDAAVTPKYVHGFEAKRELPIVWKIARASVFNKLVILLPVALLLSAFAPWMIPPLLMLGGAYLCFEGAEKIHHWLSPAHHDVEELTQKKMSAEDSAHLEEQKVKGAIKTDFILSAEIMTIALAALETDNIWFRAGALAVVAIGITMLVYGAVALIVKADDVGLHMAANGRAGVTRQTGELIVRGMPGFLAGLTVVGTAAMLWVGGSIIVHSLAELGWHGPEDWIDGVAHAVGGESGLIIWLVKAAIDGVFGIVLGMLIIPVVTYVIAPTMRAVGMGADTAH